VISTAADASNAAFLNRAHTIVAQAAAQYGWPSPGPLYDAHLRYLTDPNQHNFRLEDLPALTGDAAILQRTSTILDLGCGPGTLVFQAARRGYDAVGIDLAQDKIELAALWVDALGYPQEWKSRVRIEDGGDLPFDEQTFDVVSSYHVLEHVADLPSVLHEAVRVTKRGGWLDLRAPDYRMSYDTHYCMPWPRFMPPAQSRRWVEAMGRPAGGIGTFFYVTGPQVIALLEALGCRIHNVLYREHRDSRITPFTGKLMADPIHFRSDHDVAAFANELKALEAAGRLPAIYKTCLEFTIVAQRL
jgi:SAM-dependent methyltransferase